MPESDSFWDFYWEVRLRAFEHLGKREAILALSRLIRRQFAQTGRGLRLLELGCGEGQIIGLLADAHMPDRAVQTAVGIDYKHASVLRCQKDFPSVRCIEGDFTDLALLTSVGELDVIILVNALHEVFSAQYSPALGQVDADVGKQQVRLAFQRVAGLAAPGGYIVLFDGLEMPGDLQEPLRVRMLNRETREHFAIFAETYQPFRIAYRELDDPYEIELSRRDFTRFLTKSIFLGKPLWKTERLESYQYFQEAEFRSLFADAGWEIEMLRTFIENEEKWRNKVEILTPGIPFPQEHILIIARKRLPTLEI